MAVQNGVLVGIAQNPETLEGAAGVRPVFQYFETIRITPEVAPIGIDACEIGLDFGNFLEKP